MADSADDILKRSQSRADLIAEMMDRFESLIDEYGVQLTEEIINQLLDGLNTEDGIILTDAENMRKVAIIDKIWAKFQDEQGIKILSNFITDLTTINDENLKYYRKLSEANIKPADIKNIINQRLGLDENDNPVKGGYMKGLMDDVSVRNDIKNYTFNKITQGAGFKELSKGLKTLIVGDPDNKGAFNQFYRNYAFDTYTQIDRLNGALYSEKLGLKYFIFQGTRRKASRYFCLERKGKVFSIDEAKEWVNLIGKTKTVDGAKGPKRIPIGPIVEDKASYNPLIDLGGFGCVDIASFISEKVAFQLRPDLKKTA